MQETVAIIDYGSGNLRSAAKSFEKVIEDEGLGIKVTVTSRPEEILKASKIVLPGQGAFGSCMNGLSSIEGMLDALKERVIKQGYPFLGICVGMQLMADTGLEHGTHKGLGWIGGSVVRMEPSDKSLKIPHMGWNSLCLPEDGYRHPLVKNVLPEDHFYFVHSFVFQLIDMNDYVAGVEYGGRFSAIVGRDNMAGVQFHPEKSQKAGLRMIGDFLNWKP